MIVAAAGFGYCFADGYFDCPALYDFARRGHLEIRPATLMGWATWAWAIGTMLFSHVFIIGADGRALMDGVGGNRAQYFVSAAEFHFSGAIFSLIERAWAVTAAGAIYFGGGLGQVIGALAVWYGECAFFGACDRFF